MIEAVLFSAGGVYLATCYGSSTGVLLAGEGAMKQ